MTETLSEEMRILYVALTRAKEKLYITGLKKDYDKDIENMQNQVNRYHKVEDKINYILVKKYKKYLDWILLVYLYEKDQAKGLLKLNILKKQELLKTFVKPKEEEIDVRKVLNTVSVEKEEVKALDKILEYQYPYELSTTIPTMTSVTKIKQVRNEEEEPKEEKQSENAVTFHKPKFLRKDETEILTNAQKGTLVHLCMQRLHENVEYDLPKVKELIQDLVTREIITDIEAKNINPYNILTFTKSNIWQELKNAKKIYKEKPFFINIPAKEIYGENLEEDILVQGIIDLYYINQQDEIILVDYKTDYVEKGKEHSLIEKYRVQLDLYKRALEETLRKKVSKVYIYSVYLGKEIEIY